MKLSFASVWVHIQQLTLTYSILIGIVVATYGLLSCSFSNTNLAVEKRFNTSTWLYADSLILDIKGASEQYKDKLSKIMLKLAVSENYRYRNIHLVLQPVRASGKGKPIPPMKIELQLSDPEGNWLVDRSILDRHYHFDLALLDSLTSEEISSVNSIRLRHSMREDSLKGITAVQLVLTN